jgi:hypothetical protein
MIHIRKWASVLWLVLLSINCSVSKAQESVTDNLINQSADSWSGCYTVTGSPTFGGVSGGPCPAVSDNYVIFSYGQYTLSQSIAINQALNASGSGLQVTGYNYYWSVKNSNINGEQPGSYDPVAYIDVNLYNKSGSLLESDRYNYGYYIGDWTTFSGTRTYTSSYSSSSLDNIQLSVTGADSGYWAGYYGAEFANFSLTLNYSVKSKTPTVPNTASIDPTKIDSTFTDVGGIEMSTSGGFQIPDSTSQVTKSTNSTSIGLTVISNNREKERSTIRQQQESILEENSLLALSFTRAGSILDADSNNLTSPTNPINNAINGGTRLPDSGSQEKTGPTVKKDVQNNSLAGGVDITRMVQVPAGFESYLGTVPDGRMYEPKEIYRRQRNVDNAGATRFLNNKNDILHQLMIEQQYNIGN